MRNWTVDLKNHCATSGNVSVSFYQLADGGFSLGPASDATDNQPVDIQGVCEAISRAIEVEGWPASEASPQPQ